MATQAATAAPSIVKIPRLLVVDAAVTASAQLFPALLTIPQDADFEWWWLAISRTSGLLKMLLTEAGTSRALIFPGSQLQAGTQFLGVNVDNLAGTVAANGSFPIAVPYVMPASRTYTHQFTDSSGAPNTVEIVYHGFALLAVPSNPS
jgi:hypothetical protein